LERGVSFDVLKGCVAVDGDTYDVPAIIEVAETRWRVHGMPPSKNGHRQKFGDDPAKHRDFSAVTHVAKGKGIPPFLILHVANQADVSAQAFRLGAVLKEAGVPARVFGAKDTEHSKLNGGRPGDEGAVRVRRGGGNEMIAKPYRRAGRGRIRRCKLNVDATPMHRTQPPTPRPGKICGRVSRDAQHTLPP
jgi:hypothetical protein